MSRTRYIAYGSNLHPLRLRRRGVQAELLGSDRIDGHALHFHKRGRDASGKCNILDPGDGVYVAVYEISVAEKQRLDRIEGVGRGYQSSSITLRDYGECYTYIAEQGHIDNGLAPFDWYREMVIAGCRFHGFPDSYVDEITSISTISDPDSERDGENWETVEVLKRG